MDRLVVTSVNGSKRDLTIKIQKMIAGIGLAKDAVLEIPVELARCQDVIGTIFYPIMRPRTVVHERSA